MVTERKAGPTTRIYLVLRISGVDVYLHTLICFGFVVLNLHFKEEHLSE